MAYIRTSNQPGRYIRIGYDEAKLEVATGRATQEAFRPLAPRRNPRATYRQFVAAWDRGRWNHGRAVRLAARIADPDERDRARRFLEARGVRANPEYRVRAIDPNDRSSTRTLIMSEEEVRDSYPHWGGKATVTSRDGMTVRITPVRKRRRNPADGAVQRYSRAVGHGETVATAKTAARNPGHATGRTAPNCPRCGALVRLRNPVPSSVTCASCGQTCMVRRP